MPLRVIVLATRNPGKAREIRSAIADLPVSISSVDEFGDVDEPQETGATFAENARAKALYYARATRQWSLADDSGLAVDALAGRPGVLSARYAADRCKLGADRRTLDRAGNAKLLEELRGVEDSQRTARFLCHLALADSRGVFIEADGIVEGLIARAPRGENGFGYDPIFHLPELGRTVAELTAEQKNRISHRGRAVRQFARRLRALLHLGPQ